MSNERACTYVTYVQCAPERLWSALTDPGVSAQWWVHRNVSDWKPGSAWEHQRADGSRIADVTGTVLESTPPHRLVLTWANPQDGTPVGGVPPQSFEERRAMGPSRVTFDIAQHGDIVRLTVRHENLVSDAERAALFNGWAAVLSNLKTFLEAGRPLPQPPWEMLPGFVRN